MYFGHCIAYAAFLIHDCFLRIGRPFRSGGFLGRASDTCSLEMKRGSGSKHVSRKGSGLKHVSVHNVTTHNLMMFPWIRYIREGLYTGSTQLPRTPLEPPNVRRSSSWVALGVLTSSKAVRRSDSRVSLAVLPLPIHMFQKHPTAPESFQISRLPLPLPEFCIGPEPDGHSRCFRKEL